jgi:DNA-binding MarR family transcriptional regulator
MIRLEVKPAKVSTSEISDTEEQVLKSLRRIIRAVDLYSRKLFAQTGLSGPQLICLRQLSSFGTMQTSHLAEAVNLSSATVCGILDRLEERGLVIRERQSDDRRRVLVSLSGAGRDTVENAPPALHDSFLFKLRVLPAEQQQRINNTLTNIVTMMAADELDAAPILVPGEAVTPGPDRKP